MRLLIHGLMVASMEIKHVSVATGGNVARAMCHTRTSGFYLEEMSDLFAKDFVKIKQSTGYTADDASMGLHLALAALCRCTKETPDFAYSHQLPTHLMRYCTVWCLSSVSICYFASIMYRYCVVEFDSNICCSL
jgi:hypothetical protein